MTYNEAKTKYLNCLKTFIKSASDLENAWQEWKDEGWDDSDINYPEYLPSFDEFVSDLYELEYGIAEKEEQRQTKMRRYNITLQAEVESTLRSTELRDKLVVALWDGEDTTTPDGKSKELQVIDYKLTEVIQK